MKKYWDRKLHIYGQQSWHGDAYIVGNKEALLGLKEAIDMALNQNKNIHSQYAADGEGYNLFVINATDEEMNKLMLPYIDEHAANPEKGIHPINILGKNYIQMIIKNREDDEKNK